MFAEFVVYAILSCPVTKLENRTKIPWNAQDFEAMIGSMEQERCAHHFEHKPCLEKFYKLRPGSYFAGCGPKGKNARAK